MAAAGTCGYLLGHLLGRLLSHVPGSVAELARLQCLKIMLTGLRSSAAEGLPTPSQ